ncbi:hypothetical protein ELH43_39135 [Rhizobium ruizarguesonis]|nr:hypothetical protein EHH54_42695 [Rhizobium leguminosarum]TAW18113.1 hypothetical protein ELI25_20955 [Rhizobium ruizarguesonis]RWX28854.1 hypothetical protein EHH54_31955 [Rhizobium leguminosarum]TAY75837.1 hypothetical protein ELH84_19150 [Rhizobium ruizarguesonis]TAZ53688.1 hypothetical protein ELH76_22260 [Rhizobium ruizarguesonis]
MYACDRLFLSSLRKSFTAGVVTLFECGQVRPSLRFSGRPCTHGFPRGHCLASMGSNLCCGAVGLGWDEEVSHGGEDRRYVAMSQPTGNPVAVIVAQTQSATF